MGSCPPGFSFSAELPKQGFIRSARPPHIFLTPCRTPSFLSSGPKTEREPGLVLGTSTISETFEIVVLGRDFVFLCFYATQNRRVTPVHEHADGSWLILRITTSPNEVRSAGADGVGIGDPEQLLQRPGKQKRYMPRICNFTRLVVQYTRFHGLPV